MRIGALSMVLAVAVSCAAAEKDADYESCSNLCDELIGNCAYDAYPTNESCMAGCADQVNADVDISDLEECIVEAECDTFEIVECQHHLGVES